MYIGRQDNLRPEAYEFHMLGMVCETVTRHSFLEWMPWWTPESGPESGSESSSQVTVIALLFVSQGWIPRGVASQKNRSDASDVPSLAPQHTFSARKEPENNGLGFLLSPARSPDDPKNCRCPRTPSTAWTPIRIPVRTLGSTTASIRGTNVA